MPRAPHGFKAAGPVLQRFEVVGQHFEPAARVRGCNPAWPARSEALAPHRHVSRPVRRDVAPARDDVDDVGPRKVPAVPGCDRRQVRGRNPKRGCDRAPAARVGPVAGRAGSLVARTTLFKEIPVCAEEIRQGASDHPERDGRQHRPDGVRAGGARDPVAALRHAHPSARSRTKRAARTRAGAAAAHRNAGITSLAKRANTSEVKTLT